LPLSLPALGPRCYLLPGSFLCFVAVPCSLDSFLKEINHAMFQKSKPGTGQILNEAEILYP